MLRWTMSFAAAIFTVESAATADLPRGGGKAPPIHSRPAQQESDLLFTPSDDRYPYVRLPPPTPLLPGSAALPSYYGSHFSYEYHPYYGGPNLSYWYRLPYACGVYGYC